ncbi:MAG TPA: prepilin-type N-terminal cleavage/methylation domain-containing protein [Candidatus Saccharimonadales bacterium]|nr:prepilin-type N-terminal cleavage/methylation domain-containing protein [Candidatus Saccharimonadales bacterium]
MLKLSNGQREGAISATGRWRSRAAVIGRRRPGFAGSDRRQTGDTIVEVLIAIAIVSLVLTAAYVITNKNTVAIQANQERIQAQHLVAAQIESLRAQNGLTTSGDCFVDGAETASAGCNNFTEAGSGATYTAVITGPVSGVYTVSATWSSLDGTHANDSNITMYYRLQ